MLDDLQASVPISVISARVHNSIARMSWLVARQLSKQTGITRVALSGGVWQNMTLLHKTLDLMHPDGFQIYVHSQAPTNDGGIALGQAVVASSRVMAVR